MSQSIAALYLAICVTIFPVAHHVLEESAATQLQGPSGTGPSLGEESDHLYGLLDQLFFLLPGHDGEGASIFVRGGSSQSDRTLAND